MSSIVSSPIDGGVRPLWPAVRNGLPCFMAINPSAALRRSRREPGMHAHRREEVGIGRGGNDCRRAAGGQPRNVDARRVGRMIAQDRCRAIPAISDGSPDPRTDRSARTSSSICWSSRLAAGMDRPPGGRTPRPGRSSASLSRNHPVSARSRAASPRAASGRGLRTDFRLRRNVELVATLALIARIASKLEGRAGRNGRLDARCRRTRRHPTCFDPGNGLGQAFARFFDRLGFPRLRLRESDLG